MQMDANSENICVWTCLCGPISHVKSGPVSMCKHTQSTTQCPSVAGVDCFRLWVNSRQMRHDGWRVSGLNSGIKHWQWGKWDSGSNAGVLCFFRQHTNYCEYLKWKCWMFSEVTISRRGKKFLSSSFDYWRRSWRLRVNLNCIIWCFHDPPINICNHHRSGLPSLPHYKTLVAFLKTLKYLS